MFVAQDGLEMAGFAKRVFGWAESMKLIPFNPMNEQCLKSPPNETGAKRGARIRRRDRRDVLQATFKVSP